MPLANVSFRQGVDASMMRTRCTHISLPSAALLGLALLLCVAPRSAADDGPAPMVFGLGQERLPIRGEIRVHRDPDGDLGIHDLLERADSLAWEPLAGGIPCFGYTSDTIWLHFRILNRSDREDLIFSLDQSVVDEMEFVQVEDGRIVGHQLLGDRFPFGDRPIESENLTLATDIPIGAIHDVYVRLTSESSVQAPMTLWTKAPFFRAANVKSMLNGLLFGVILAIVAYGAVVYATLRDRNYLTFALYTLTFMLVPFTLQGYGYHYLWPGSPWLQNHAFLIILPLLSVTSIVFARRILDYPRHLPRLDRALRWYALAKLVSIAPLLLLPYPLGIRYSMVTGLGDELLILATSVFIVRKHRFRPAGYFAAAWIAFLAGTLSLVLNRFGLIAESIATGLGPSLGIAAQALVMSLGLAESVRDSRTAALNAEQALVKHRREAGRKLKMEVQKRTAELQQVMRQLAKVNEEFEEANRLDGLTHVFNRSAFDDRLNREYSRAQRGNTEVTLVMIDIDHFKRFNDDHGHLVGDQCLIEVARTIDRTARRTDDFTARYGGEEFAVILVNTPHATALQVAERIRLAVEQLDFRVEGRRVPVTISLGVCTVRPTLADSQEALVATADAALYQAKEAGRNQVVGAETLQPVEA